MERVIRNPVRRRKTGKNDIRLRRRRRVKVIELGEFQNKNSQLFPPQKIVFFFLAHVELIKIKFPKKHDDN